jgi:dipeptidyl aminopeptidase/acylaminoacyl peptidase
MASYSEVMVRLSAAFLGVAFCASAAPGPFTLDQVLGSAFPTHLTAAPMGGKVAWVSNARGVINIMVAEPPAYVAHKITDYTLDDGQDIVELCWTPDARAIVYVRGEGPNRAHEIPNPALNPLGEKQGIWMVSLDGSLPRSIGTGNSVAISPRGNRVAYISGEKLWWVPIGEKPRANQLLQVRGQARTPVWSPDGSRVAFVSDREDHSFIGVFDVDQDSLRYLDPSTDQDTEPAWSPDGRSVAFLREPSHGRGRIYGARRADEPWSIRVADAATGKGHEVWKAHEGPGSVFREVVAGHQLLWADERLIFPWEGDGWTHLYSVLPSSGQVRLLTPGEFEVEFVAPSPNRAEVLFSSNQGDIDRRHLWKVAVKGGPAVALTTGQGIEWAPAETSDGKAVALFRSDAQRPAHPSILLGKEIRDMDPSAIPPDFPVEKMVTPQPVTFTSADSLTIHGQLFLPPNRPQGRAPAVIFFHGGPQRQMLLGWNYRSYYHNDYALNQYLANKGYVVLSVNYRSGIGYGLYFREALNFGSTGASEYNDVQAAGQFLQARADVDPARIGVWGGSYGGYLTAMALARESDVFKVGVDLHGVHDWSAELDIPATDPAAKVAFDSSPMAYVGGWRSPVLLVHGDDDRNVKFNQTVVLADALRKRHVPVEELIFPDEVHEFLLYRHWREAFEAADRFLEKYLLR